MNHVLYQLPNLSAGDGRNGDILNGALKQMFLGVMGRMLEEMARVVEERTRDRVDRILSGMEERTQRMEETVLNMERRMEQKIRNLEQGMQRTRSSEGIAGKNKGPLRRLLQLQQKPLVFPERLPTDSTFQLEERMEALETSLQKALGVMMPKVDTLLQQLEGRPPDENLASSVDNLTAVDAPFALEYDSCPASSLDSIPSAVRASTSDIPPPPSPDTRRRLGAALLDAAVTGKTEVVQTLLERGADVDARARLRNHTPLLRAARNGHAGVVALLVSWGADVDAQDAEGWTALHWAAARDASGRCAELLVDGGANVNKMANDDCTPLHVAASGNNEAAARVLVEAGASKTAVSNGGLTPYGFATTDAVRSLLRR